MALEQVFKCPRTLNKFREGPLGELMDGFCAVLLENGFAPGTIRKHLSNVHHLNVYLGTRNYVDGQVLSAEAIREFFTHYPTLAQHRGSLDRHIAAVKASVNRLVSYLRCSDRFEASTEVLTYQPLLDAYLTWLHEHQHAAPGTIRLRAHSVGYFLCWLGSQATPQGCAELTHDTVEHFFLTYADSKGHAARRSMQAALRTFFRFCLQQGYIQHPLDRAVPTLRCYKLSTVARGLSDEQALKLLQCIDRRSHAGRRDYAICQLLYTYGVRGGQLRALRLEDIDWVADRILFRALKHGKDSWLPLTRVVGESLARLAAIRCLFAFIARQQPELLLQCQQIRAIPLKRTGQVKVDYLEEAELQALMDAVDLKTRTGVRDRALLLLLYNTGARVSEIVALNLNHLRLSGSAQVDLQGKGNKHRACPLWPETVVALKDYLRQRRPNQPETQTLFLNANGVPITRFGIRHIIGKYATIAAKQCSSIKTKTVTPHTLRHTTAMHLLRSGNDINMVSYWLGHADINTTHIYLEIDMEMKRRMIEKVDAPIINDSAPWHKPGIIEWLNTLGSGSRLCEVNPLRMKPRTRLRPINFT